MTELTLVTGAVEAMIVDYQCIMPSLGQVAQCYHTKMYSTSDIDQLPLAGSAPEWYSEKAATIAFYVMASGIFTHLGRGHAPNIRE